MASRRDKEEFNSWQNDSSQLQHASISKAVASSNLILYFLLCHLHLEEVGDFKKKKRYLCSVKEGGERPVPHCFPNPNPRSPVVQRKKRGTSQSDRQSSPVQSRLTRRRTNPPDPTQKKRFVGPKPASTPISPTKKRKR